MACAALVGGAINSVAGGGSFLTFPALILAGVPAIPANATNNTAMWLGVVASARGYREEVRAHRHLLVAAGIVSVVGAVIGAVLLLQTPPKMFVRMIPWLLLFATAVFALSPLITKRQHAARPHTPVQLVIQFLIAIYGGYFGAGMGIIMLAVLSFSGLPNMNAANALKNVLSVIINGTAIIPFVIAGMIIWKIALLMAIFTMIGGYAGSRFFRRVPSSVTRVIVLCIGVAMSAYFFVK